MSSNRFFVGQIHSEGDTIAIEGEDAHKIQHVLRMHTGDMITICDSSASEFQAVLKITGARVQAMLDKKISDIETNTSVIRITVAQAIPKGQKMDFVIEKLTEFGVATIVPLITERSIANATPAKLERWKRLAKTAAQQSGRRDIPTIEESATLQDFLARHASFDRVLFPWELAGRQPLRDTLPRLLENVQNLAIIIGPEGGFSHAEADAARAAGATPISLGFRILRTETAALAVIAVVNYLKER